MTTASTMDEADRHAKKGAGDGTVIIAENQTDARGRFRRQWISNLGNLSLPSASSQYLFQREISLLFFYRNFTKNKFYNCISVIIQRKMKI